MFIQTFIHILLLGPWWVKHYKNDSRYLKKIIRPSYFMLREESKLRGTFLAYVRLGSSIYYTHLVLDLNVQYRLKITNTFKIVKDWPAINTNKSSHCILFHITRSFSISNLTENKLLNFVNYCTCVTICEFMYFNVL